MKPTPFTNTPDTSDEAAKLTPEAFDKARLRVAGRDTSRAEWQAAVQAALGKPSSRSFTIHWSGC
ncbi:MAG TPA: hypothetical protein PK440_10630 [Candidatus Accumulibacter phosphatis]|nr:MAG: hypothetical protein AW07_03008 [Candidatus Accumulibacter sp. SK-11]HRL77348.1 hypothetical protein [Candidatus Accumulibacter phosphatis]HRQ95432.1 hypothetical protein [Candidatus Accumulibacter phosphatis]